MAKRRAKRIVDRKVKDEILEEEKLALTLIAKDILILKKRTGSAKNSHGYSVQQQIRSMLLLG
jgi:hypothetical protein